MAVSTHAVNFEDFNFNDDHTKKNQQIINDIIEKRTEVLKIVEALSEVLTNENKDIRRRGVDFLSWLLTSIPTDFLNPTEVTYFSEFFCDRLKDHHSIVPFTLMGILALVKMKNISAASVNQLLQQIFQFVTCQSQLAQDRYTLYSIIKLTGENHLGTLQQVSGDTIFGLISSMEGETDPKNLLLLFSFAPDLLCKLSADHLTEDVFEVFSTYFPVDFTTVSKDDLIITREDLADGLANCLTATEGLSLQCFPLVLEKLDSTLKTAKIDSYKLLGRCCVLINTSQIEGYLNLLWKMIQRDVLPSMHSAVQDSALTALTSMVGVLSRDAKDEQPLNRFLDDIIISVRTFLTKPDDSLFIHAMRVLAALCPQSALATSRVFLELQALCLQTYKSDIELSSLLQCLLPFLEFKGADISTLQSICSFTVGITNHASDNVRALAFVALRKMFDSIASDPGVRSALYNSITQNQWPKSSKSGSECYKLLRLLAAKYPNEVISSVYSELEHYADGGNYSLERFLDVSSTIADIPSLTSHVVPRCLGLASREETAELVAQSLLEAFKNNNDSLFAQSLYELKMCETLIPSWLQKFEGSSLLSLAHLLKEMVSRLSVDFQIKLVFAVMGSSGDLLLLQALLQNHLENEKMVIVLEGILGAIRPSLEIPRLSELIVILIKIALNSNCCYIRESAGRLIASFVNKFGSTCNLAAKCIERVPGFEDRCISLKSWVLKGGLLCGSPDVDLDDWFSSLQDSQVSNYVAECTQSLVREDPVFLNQSCHCIVRLLYRQRVFCYVSKLLGNLPPVSDPHRDNYLLALIAITEAVPKQVWKNEETSVGGLVSQAVLSNDTRVVLPALHLLKNLLEEKSSIFTDQMTNLLPALLRLSTFTNSLKVRCSALQCLFLAGCYPTIVTLPYKSQVVRLLISCLGDNKRLVRGEAARARGRWCLIGAVGEDALLSA